MNRGDLVIVRERGSLASKARPCVVVQNQQSLGSTLYINICPLTSTMRQADMIRVLLLPNAMNGLKMPSSVEVDLIDSVLVSRIGGVIGCVDSSSMRKIDTALRQWLDL